MNLYLDVEIASRELDSKLLLATLAAKDGHHVFISSISLFRSLFKRGLIRKGVFHAKSLTPKESKIRLHHDLRAKGFKVTSIDEEAGLITFDYERFACQRFSEETISQASAVFCWGPHDAQELVRIYPSFKDKIHCTGSPRVDLWKSQFSSFWKIPKSMPARPYLLFSSNFTLLHNYRPFWERVKSEREAGSYKRDPKKVSNKYHRLLEQMRLIYHFINAIEYVADACKDIDIVVRPHPVENPEYWKAYLEPQPKLHISRSGSITPWVNNAIAVIHNGCTTALEATVSGTPVITYIPIEQKYGNELPNRLGTRVHTKRELIDAVAAAVNKKSSNRQYTLPHANKIIEHKIYYREHELAADRIIKIWGKIGQDLPSETNDWNRISRLLNLARIKRRIRSILPFVRPSTANVSAQSYKFPPLDSREITEKMDRLKSCLGITTQFDVRILDARGILVKKKG